MQTDIAVVPNTGPSSTMISESNLTELQLLYWIGHQLDPSAVHFNNVFSFAFTTSICPDIFQQAFDTAVSQYDVMRTVFREEKGVPKQQVLAAPPAPLCLVDFTAEPDPAAAAMEWQRHRAQRPFQLEHGLYDSALLLLNEEASIWFINMHHLITDASSFFLIAETLLGHYATLRQGEKLTITEKPPFSRYVDALQRQQASSRAAKSHAFWQEKVSQPLDPANFYGRLPAKRNSQVRRWIYNLGTEQTTRLIALAEQADLGTTTSELRQFCLTATLFFSLMHQLTGNSHLGLVTTIHNRATQVNRQTAGVLMELCPVQVTVDQGETFTTLLHKVTEEMKQLLLHYRHGASRAASDLALDVMFTFVQRPSLSFDEQIVKHTIVHPGHGSERLGLHIHHLADDNSFDLYLDFHLDIFTEEEQAHAQQSLQKLLARLLENPDASIQDGAIPWPAFASEDLGLNGNGNGRSKPSYAPPTTPIESQLQQIWEEILDRSPIGIHDDFFDLGGESLRAMSFLSKFEAATGHYLPLSTLLRSSTIAALASQIETETKPDAIITIQPGSPDVPSLFLIPGAAGNTLALNRVAKNMLPEQPIYTFQTPDLDVEDFPAANVEHLAVYYREAIQDAQPQGPYYLGGYSAGGILAYEVAQQLRQVGETVPFLVVIDMPAPNPGYKSWWRVSHFLAKALRLSSHREEAIFLWGRDNWNRATFFRVFGSRRILRNYKGRIVRFRKMTLKRKLHHMQRRFKNLPGEREIRQREAAAGAQINRTPEPRDMDASSITDPRARALFEMYDKAARKYLPQSYDGRITLLRCPLGYGRKEIRSPYPHYGWKRLTKDLDVHTIQEAHGHLALLREPAVAVVGQTIQTTLSKTMNKDDSK